MKKLLTTAALLTIGTAASFATSFELTGNSTYGSDYVSAGRAAFSSISLDSDTTFSSGVSLDGSSYSWSISFSIDKLDVDEDSDGNVTAGNSATSQKTLFSVTSSGNVGQGYGVIAYNDGSSIYYSLTSAAQYHADTTTTVDGETTTEYVSSYVIGSAIESSAGQTITISWDAVMSTLSLSVGDTTVSTDSLDTAVSLTTSNGSNVGSDGSSVFWTNNAANPISNISLTVKEIPEPSMFGLLAGLGAIGLVAARRRRNRKA